MKASNSARESDKTPHQLEPRWVRRLVSQHWLLAQSMQPSSNHRPLVTPIPTPRRISPPARKRGCYPGS